MLMSEQYIHTLIPVDKEFVPSAGEAQTFCWELVDRQVIPVPIAIRLRTPSDRTRTVVNPFTQETMIWPMMDHRDLAGIDEINTAVSALSDYELEIAGVGTPGAPPLPIDFDEPYHVGVTVRVHPALRSTSSAWIDDATPVAQYGEPSPTLQPCGYFTNPHTGETIKVPGAGCARFWIEVELGKFLFPAIQNCNLELLDPQIVSSATRIFGVQFVQGIGPCG
jgi:hypothetical protein